ncbi:TPA: hypothetical protein DCF80_03575 [Candidatus Saccharibacteria bacterium]|nr:hypothetical protein [Candidatus Saccharibacteria bacterium]HRK40692.1 YdcF family protein [Candidatus Saccharibacteria bacterium]
MRYILLGIVLLIAIVISSISIYLTPNDLDACEIPEQIGSCARADAIVTVSGGDTNARVDEAVRLYKAGWAPKLIFSGAAADTSGPSNAEAMARRAQDAGVSKSAIITEEFSRTTAENALNTSKFIADQSIERIILVTSAYHQRRASLEFSAILGPSVTIINKPLEIDRQWAGSWWWTTFSGWWLAGGELVKIGAFYSMQGDTKL